MPLPLRDDHRLWLLGFIRLAHGVAAFAAGIALVLDLGLLRGSAYQAVLLQAQLALCLVFVLGHLGRLLLDWHPLADLRVHWLEFSLIGLLGLMAAALTWWPHLFHDPSAAFHVTVRVYLGFQIAVLLARSHEGIVRLHLHPSMILVASFAVVIALGTFLLLLPRATAGGEVTGLVDAFFTATSAVCVTGLTVVNTGSHFTRFGQIVILVLIQIGGLGLMTFTAFFGLLLGRNLGVREKVVLADMFNFEVVGRLRRLIAGILILTLVIEFLGSAALFYAWSGNFPSLSEAAFSSVFHSVSAFNNAGFSLFSRNLQGYRLNLPVNLTITFLIILGGLGFTVNLNCLSCLWGRVGRRKGVPRLSVQTKVVLLTTALLIVGGTLGFLASEWKHTLAGYSWDQKLLISYFQSVTPRTAGFNTVNIGSLSVSTSLLLMLLMFTGASPGGTGGGIKTSTLGMVVGVIRSILRGRENVEIFHRTIPRELANRALAVVFIALTVVFFSTFFLSLTEKAPLENLAFEVVSAFGTVGLSRGITPQLTDWGKLILSATMLVGRAGPLTLAFALAYRETRGVYTYPEERIMIG